MSLATLKNATFIKTILKGQVEGMRVRGRHLKLNHSPASFAVIWIDHFELVTLLCILLRIPQYCRKVFSKFLSVQTFFDVAACPPQRMLAPLHDLSCVLLHC